MHESGKIIRLAVAKVAAEVVGVSLVIHYPSEGEGRFHLILSVWPVYRKQGVGQALYEEALAFAKEKGAVILFSEVLEGETAGLQFAQKRGFGIRVYEIGWQLDLTAFDESPLAGVVAEVEARGLRFSTYAAEGDTIENRRKLYAINRVAVIDDPFAYEATFPDFETWQRIIVEAAWFQPEGQWLVIDPAHGDAFVGLSGVVIDVDEQVADTTLTGVERAYRGRKLGQALKWLVTRYAGRAGARKLVTTTDARNGAMIAINEKLGYKRQAGFYALICEEV